MTQINLMSLVAAVLVLAAAFIAAWILKTRGLREGVWRGLVWAAVAILWQLMIGLANGTTAALAVPGIWVYFAAFTVGPIIAGWLRPRPARALTASESEVAHQTDL